MLRAVRQGVPAPPSTAPCAAGRRALSAAARVLPSVGPERGLRSACPSRGVRVAVLGREHRSQREHRQRVQVVPGIHQGSARCLLYRQYMTRSFSRSEGCFVVLIGCLAGCQGSMASQPAPANASGGSRGTTPVDDVNGGGAASQLGTGGAAPGSGTGGCLAIGYPPACEYASPSECPKGAHCYGLGVCGGGTVWCCDTPPSCGADVQLAANQACPSGGDCYTLSQCEIEVTCFRFSAERDAGTGSADDDGGT